MISESSEEYIEVSETLDEGVTVPMRSHQDHGVPPPPRPAAPTCTPALTLRQDESAVITPAMRFHEGEPVVAVGDALKRMDMASPVSDEEV